MISPFSNFSKPAIVLSIVVLPIPDGPNKQTMSPSFLISIDKFLILSLPPALKVAFFISKKLFIIIS